MVADAGAGRDDPVSGNEAVLMDDSPGFGMCAGCGNPLTDREMFHGHDCCDACMERDADLYDDPADEAFWDEDEDLRT